MPQGHPAGRTRSHRPRRVSPPDRWPPWGRGHDRGWGNPRLLPFRQHGWDGEDGGPIERAPIDWVWEGRLARGMFTLLEGDPGIGKGLLSIDIAARLTRGWPLPGEQHTIAVLNGLSGAAQGLRLRVSKAVTRIGAAPDNEMVLDGDDFISGHHLTLKAEANALFEQ